MPERVLLQLDSQGRPTWLETAQRGALPMQAWPPAGREAVLLLPAEAVLLTRAPRVARSEGLLRQALPFAVEDRLATPVEQLHFAFSGAGDPVELAVVEARRLQEALAALDAQGLTAVAAYSEASLLPATEPGHGLVVLAGERVLLRSADGVLLSERASLLPQLMALLEEAKPTAAWTVIRCGDAALDALPPALALQAQSVSTLSALLALRLGSPAGPDLLQGRFAPRLRGDALPWLKRAAAVGGLAVLLAFAQALVERQQLQARIESQQMAMADLLREALPGTTTVVDPRAQLEIEYTRLLRGAGGDDALALLARVAPSVAGSSRYTLESIDYRSGGLELTLRAPDVATLDGLREALSGLGLAAELTSATPGQGGVEGRISLRAGRA